jgi:hypothetical protein
LLQTCFYLEDIMNKWLLLGLVVLLAGCSSAATGQTGALTYGGPVELKIEKGQTLPGTGVQYVGNSPDGAEMTIDGQKNTKRIGDSLQWKGEMVPGAAVDLSTRIVTINDQQVTSAGTVQVAVADARPEAGPADTTAPVRYKVPVAYQVKRGEAIPGTTIVYQGMEGTHALLSNVDGNGQRTIGQTIAWSGRLRDRVGLQLDLKTVLFTANTLNVAGTAEVLLAP